MCGFRNTHQLVKRPAFKKTDYIYETKITTITELWPNREFPFLRFWLKPKTNISEWLYNYISLWIRWKYFVFRKRESGRLCIHQTFLTQIHNISLSVVIFLKKNCNKEKKIETNEWKIIPRNRQQMFGILCEENVKKTKLRVLFLQCVS